MVRGTCILPSGGGVRGHSFSCLGSGSLSCAVVLGMGAALSVSSVSRVLGSESMVWLLLLVLVSRERAVSAMMMWALTMLLLLLLRLLAMSMLLVSLLLLLLAAVSVILVRALLMLLLVLQPSVLSNGSGLLFTECRAGRV